ncbi:hypothetical protein SNEBB_010356 [Seison nebaliae]|nr:hypothetical protein SNEBB_010356 [Seison nebaliae]
MTKKIQDLLPKSNITSLTTATTTITSTITASKSKDDQKDDVEGLELSVSCDIDLEELNSQNSNLFKKEKNISELKSKEIIPMIKSIPLTKSSSNIITSNTTPISSITTTATGSLTSAIPSSTITSTTTTVGSRKRHMESRGKTNESNSHNDQPKTKCLSIGSIMDSGGVDSFPTEVFPPINSFPTEQYVLDSYDPRVPPPPIPASLTGSQPEQELIAKLTTPRHHPDTRKLPMPTETLAPPPIIMSTNNFLSKTTVYPSANPYHHSETVPNSNMINKTNLINPNTLLLTGSQNQNCTSNILNLPYGLQPQMTYDPNISNKSESRLCESSNCSFSDSSVSSSDSHGSNSSNTKTRLVHLRRLVRTEYDRSGMIIREEILYETSHKKDRKFEQKKEAAIKDTKEMVRVRDYENKLKSQLGKSGSRRLRMDDEATTKDDSRQVSMKRNDNENFDLRILLNQKSEQLNNSQESRRSTINRHR